jgi:hypothetical protein
MKLPGAVAHPAIFAQSIAMAVFADPGDGRRLYFEGSA